jgi:hypothetical protein
VTSYFEKPWLCLGVKRSAVRIRPARQAELEVGLEQSLNLLADHRSGGMVSRPAPRRAFAALVGVGGMVASAVPFILWAKGVHRRELHAYDAFELGSLGIDLRILAYLIIGVGILGVLASLGILAGSSKMGVVSAVLASVLGLGLALSIFASLAIAQMLVFPYILSFDGGYSFPPALAALVVAAGSMLAGTILMLRIPNSRDPKSESGQQRPPL